MNAMRITRIETIPVVVPLKRGFSTKTALTEHRVSPYVIVRVHTDEDLIGLGEATLSPRWSGETSPGCVAALEGLIAPHLIGEDPTEVRALRLRMDRVIRFNPFTKAAVEMALWDLAGKAADVPVYKLLGGKVRSEVPLRITVGAFAPSHAAATAKEFLGRGFKCLKVKVGLDPDDDLDRVRAVREAAGPDIPIGVDANQGWSVATARRALPLLEEFDILFAEQLIAADNPAGLAELRQVTRIPLMADESVFTLEQAWRLAALRAVDIFNVYPGKHGGIAATLEIVHVARAAGIACSMGSNLELGIGTAAMLQVAVASEDIDSERFPGDLIGPLYHEADLLTRPLDLGPKAARPPEGPGLGVELDEDQVERYHDRSCSAIPLG